MLEMLDLYCGAGGAAMGYHQALDELGIPHTITGVDIKPMPRYPFNFIQDDALEYLAAHGSQYDFIHASPQCQGYSLLKHIRNLDHYPKQIEALRELLIATGKPYAIENVPAAPLINPLMLCGTMFGLRTHKHRGFECNPPVYFAPAMCTRARVKPKDTGNRLAQYFNADAPMITVAGHMFSKEAGSTALNIDWMTKPELAQAIPPAFTRYIGMQQWGNYA